MFEQLYIAMIGTLFIAASQLHNKYMLLVVAALVFFEAISGVSLPAVATSLVKKTNNSQSSKSMRKALRIWRACIGVAVIGLFFLIEDVLGLYIGMFIGFALIGAGMYGICPLNYILHMTVVDNK